MKRPRFFLSALILALGTSAIAGEPGSNAIPTPPAVPQPVSPVAHLRSLLAASPPERSERLADKPAEERAFVLRKLAEYAALSEPERERHLRKAELRWHLRPLMEIPVAQRASRLALVPDELRSVVEERLEQWDALDEEIRRQVLENDAMLLYATRVSSKPPSPKSQGEVHWNDRLARWHELPAERRRQMSADFQQFFQLPEKERAKTLNSISPRERQQMEQMVRGFDNLPPADRAACLAALEKYAALSPEDRSRFLENAERWRQLSAHEQTVWKQLIHKLPPLPPVSAPLPIPPPPPPWPPERQ